MTQTTPLVLPSKIFRQVSDLSRSWAVRVLSIALISFAALASSGSCSLAASQTLKLYFVHTGERASITFKRDGNYDQKGLTQINRFLRDWRRNEPARMDPKLLDLVWEVYRQSGSKEFIHVVSGYRSPDTNSMLRGRSASSGVAKRSQHMLGKAMDFYIPGVSLATLRAIGMKMQFGGVGFYPTSGSPFVHMDVGNVRAWPRMSRQELAKIFPDGKTLHMPADGRPLPGYSQAVADYRRKPAAIAADVIGDDDDAPAPRDRAASLVTAMLPVPKSRAQEMIERQLGRPVGTDDALSLQVVPVPKFRPVLPEAAKEVRLATAAPAAAEVMGTEHPVSRVFFTEPVESIASLPLHGTADGPGAGFNAQRASFAQSFQPIGHPSQSSRLSFRPSIQEAAIEPARGGDKVDGQEFDAGRFWTEG